MQSAVAVQVLIAAQFSASGAAAKTQMLFAEFARMIAFFR